MAKKRKIKYTLEGEKETKSSYSIYLEKDSEGDVSVRIDGWYVMVFHTDGTFTRVSAISKGTLLRVDAEGCIVEQES